MPATTSAETVLTVHDHVPVGDHAGSRPAAERLAGDRCPGALRLHEAADGPLARIRVPGGLLTAEQVETLAELAEALGDGSLHLTARGNVEIRSVRDAKQLQAGLDAAGLLPAPTHERMRNIVASPPVAASPGVCAVAADSIDLAPTVRALDAALVAEPELGRLSGRFLFGLDDGSGDVLALQPDLAVVVLGDAAPHACRLVCGGDDAGPFLALSDAPTALAVAARAFLDIAGSDWRFDDLADPRAAAGDIARAVAAAVPTWHQATRSAVPAATDAPARSAALVAALALGTAGADAWRALAALAGRGDGLVRTTPWRSAVVAGLSLDTARGAAADLPRLGLVTDAADPWALIGACTGLPGCASSHADVRADAARLRDQMRGHTRDHPRDDGDRREGGADVPVYLSGCPRRCGHPRTAHVEAVAGTATAPNNGAYAVARAAAGGSAAGHSDVQTVSASELAAAIRVAGEEDPA